MKRAATTLLTLLLIAAPFLQAVKAAALTQGDFDSIIKGTQFYDPNLDDQICAGQDATEAVATDTGTTVKAPEGKDYTLQLPKINDPAKVTQAIDSYISKHAPRTSPFIGKGNLFVQGGSRAGVNPFFVVAIAQHESTFGTAGVSTNGSNNSFGLTAGRGQPFVHTNRNWYAFPSYDKSLVSDYFPSDGKDGQPWDEFQYLKTRYIDRNLLSTSEVMRTYAPPSENDTVKYIAAVNSRIAEMVQLAGDGVDVTLVSPPADLGSGAKTTCTTTTNTAILDGVAAIVQKNLFTSSKTIDVKAVVLHWTAGSPDTTPEALASIMKARTDVCGAGGCTVQFYVDGKGHAYQMTPFENSYAVHARQANDYAIGIEIGAGPCDGDGRACSDMLMGNQAQSSTVVALVSYLVQKYNLPVKSSTTTAGVTSHHLVDPGRKQDVGDAYYRLILNAVAQKTGR